MTALHFHSRKQAHALSIAKFYENTKNAAFSANIWSLHMKSAYIYLHNMSVLQVKYLSTYPTTNKKAHKISYVDANQSHVIYLISNQICKKVYKLCTASENSLKPNWVCKSETPNEQLVCPVIPFMNKVSLHKRNKRVIVDRLYTSHKMRN